jgi:hypothetical protein
MTNSIFNQEELKRFEDQGNAWSELRRKGEQFDYSIPEGPAKVLQAYGLLDSDGKLSTPVQQVLSAMRTENFIVYRNDPTLDDEIRSTMVRIRNLCQTHIGRYTDYSDVIGMQQEGQRTGTGAT